MTFVRAHSCLNCLRRTLSDDKNLLQYSNLLRIQWRGKKKLPKRTTVNVKLLKDIAGYGRRGFIVPVAPARMRNMWYPQGRAEYVTAKEQNESRSLVIERDHAFKINDSAARQTNLKPIHNDVNTSLLSPHRTTKILDQLVPPALEFRRQPIQTVEPTNGLTMNTNAFTGSNLSPRGIYGSVTAGDIVSSIKAAIVTNAATKDVTIKADAMRVVLAPEDIRIIGAFGMDQAEFLYGEEDDGRIKSLGEWSITIQVRGGERVTRKVKVISEEAQDNTGIGQSVRL